ncbi:MAG: hypothetical protein PARBA_02682 [Parabacteroides sp.]
MKQTVNLVCLGILALGLSAFVVNDAKIGSTKAESAKVEAVGGNPVLVQTCGNRDVSNLVYLDEYGINLIVKFGESSSFRIDWQNDQGGSRNYYPRGTTSVAIYGDRFTLSVPGESTYPVQTYCFVIER